jgi:hypothetical protein
VPQRVPKELIDRLKADVSLQRLVEASGIELKRHGADLRGLCPFHDDHDPSLVITPKKNVWNCLGACRKGGSVIDWVMRSRAVSFRHAVELLKADHPSLTTKLDHVVRKGTTEAVKLEVPFEPSAEDNSVLAQVVDYYHRTLKQTPEAMKSHFEDEKSSPSHRQVMGVSRGGHAPETRAGTGSGADSARKPQNRTSTGTGEKSVVHKVSEAH